MSSGQLRSHQGPHGQGAGLLPLHLPYLLLMQACLEQGLLTCWAGLGRPYMLHAKLQQPVGLRCAHDQLELLPPLRLGVQAPLAPLEQFEDLAPPKTPS